MKPEELTIEMLEEEVGLPPDQWHGKCHQISWAAVRLLGDEAQTAPYGHYLGPIHKDGYWGGRRAIPNSHGWVLLKDGRILDPTRWSFENREPYIYFCENDGAEYDEGGNRLRMAMMRPCPSAEGGRPANIERSNSSQRIALKQLTKTNFEDITREQMFWLANLPYEYLDIMVYPVYTLLAENNMKVLIPIDNWERAVREGRVRNPEVA